MSQITAYEWMDKNNSPYQKKQRAMLLHNSFYFHIFWKRCDRVKVRDGFYFMNLPYLTKAIHAISIFTALHRQNVYSIHVWLKLVCHIQTNMNCSPFKYWIWKENVSSKCFVRSHTNERGVLFSKPFARIHYGLWNCGLKRIRCCCHCWEKDVTQVLSSLKMWFNLPDLIIVVWRVLPIYHTHSKNVIDQWTGSSKDPRNKTVHRVA